MKKIMVFILVINLFSCEGNISKGDNEDKISDYEIKIIDSCEYVMIERGFGDMATMGLSHKGNCKFCLERKKD